MKGLSLQKISKQFNRTRAVWDASLDVAGGEIVGLVGESGCGKSTLARIAAKLLKPDEGRIFLDDEDVTGAAGKSLERFRRSVQIVFQNPQDSLDPRWPLRTSIGEPLRHLKKMKPSALAETVSRLGGEVGLSEAVLSRRPAQVSGGECQRAAMARTLALEPEILLCDEVVSSLDRIAQAEILNLLLKLQRGRSMGILFISHDLRAVRHLCDRVYVMQEARICESGTMAQVLENPQDPYTKQLVVSARLF